ncbi:Hypothetical protein PHPALM_19672 [Phytophthora palmivora]|uniref:MULE transposase domain-containing protein n=1 Tax=Phytophthora palmivora TaxID=4796 RepID=A0A2P4XGU3_9STRA|nr:Hypothetical protein PHPALM_19672 [Phytophthora palmivora]
MLACNVCALTRPLKIRYELLECSSEPCKAATPCDACPWKGKVLTCQELNRLMIMETGSRETLVREPRKAKVTPRLKDYGRELAAQGLKPARIRMSMVRPCELSEAEMTSLHQVQWFASNFTKRNLHRNGDYDGILAQIEELGFRHTAVFVWIGCDARGDPSIDQGSDEKPLLVGLTTKRLLLNAARDPATFVFHMDATFKLNQVAYPVIVCGVSDRCRSFHLVALLITSQRLETLYAKALVALRKIFTAVTNQKLLFKYVMADATAAQQNAVAEVFGMDSDFVYLLCFYHVMAKVHEKLKGVPDTLCEYVVTDIYDLHFCFLSSFGKVLARWKSDERLMRFETYFNSVWVTSVFSRWQCFHTPSGYAATNNPSLTPRVFKEVPDAIQQLKARVKDFRQRELLVDITPSRSSIEFLLVSLNTNAVLV